MLVVNHAEKLASVVPREMCRSGGACTNTTAPPAFKGQNPLGRGEDLGMAPQANGIATQRDVGGRPNPQLAAGFDARRGFTTRNGKGPVGSAYAHHPGLCIFREGR